jgi:hypothetical protein
MTGATSGICAEAMKHLTQQPGTSIVAGARGNGRIVPKVTEVLPRTLRIHSEKAFEVRSSLDNWATSTDTHSTSTNLGIDYCDIVIPGNQRVSLQFALFWTVACRWEGRDFEVTCTE